MSVSVNVSLSGGCQLVSMCHLVVGVNVLISDRYQLVKSILVSMYHYVAGVS